MLELVGSVEKGNVKVFLRVWSNESRFLFAGENVMEEKPPVAEVNSL